MRIGILGGSFDPIHNGHLMLAEQAKHQIKLSKVFFVPCGNSPYPGKQIVAPAIDRYKMTLLAIEDEKSFSANLTEVKSNKVCHTIDTVRQIKKDWGKNDYFLILGPDCMETFNTWKDYDHLQKEINIKFADKDFYCPPIPIRSSLIRDMIKDDLSIRYLVPNEVLWYIETYNVYKKLKEA